MPLTREQIDAELERREVLKQRINAELERRGAATRAPEPSSPAPQAPVSAPVADRLSPAAMLEDAQAANQRAAAAPTETPYGFSTNESGQNIYRPDLRSMPRPTGIAAIDEYVGPTALPHGGVQIAGAVRDALTGVLSLPYDLVGMDAHAKKVRDTIPQIEMSPTSKFGSTVAQYAVPGGAASKAAVGAVDASKTIQGLSPVLQSISRFLAGTSAAAATDAVVTDPDQAETIGNFTGGPTEIQPTDTGLDKRLKVGGEALAVGGAAGAAVDGLTRAAGGAHRFGKKILNPMSVAPVNDIPAEQLAKHGVDASKGREAAMAGKVMQDSAIDPAAAARGIDETQARFGSDPSFEPPTGSASNDSGLIALQRSYSTDPEIVDHHAKNLAGIDSQRLSVTGARPGAAPEGKASEFFEDKRVATLGRADEAIDGASRNMKAAEQGLLDESDRARSAARTKVEASEEINAKVAARQGELTATKNANYDGIDPNYEVGVDVSPLYAAAREAVSTNGILDSGAEDRVRQYAGPTLNRIKRAYQGQLDEAEAAKTMVDGPDSIAGDAPFPNKFQELQQIRSELSAAIAQAREDGAGDVVKRLTRLKGVYEQYTDDLANMPHSAGQRAKEANRFYKEEFAPNVREGAGGKYAKAGRSGNPMPPSKVGAHFLRSDSSAGKEAAADLNRLVGADDASVRDWLVQDMAAHVINPRTGAADVAALARWRSLRGEVLKANPGIQREITAMRSRLEGATEKVSEMDRALQEAVGSKKLVEKELRESPTRAFSRDDYGHKSIGKIMNGDRKEANMRRLITEADGDAEVVDSLRTAARKWLDNQTTNTATNINDDLATSAAKIGNMLKDDDTLGALRQLFDESEIKALRDVNDKLNLLARGNRKVTTGSDTAINIKSEADRTQKVATTLYMFLSGNGVIQSQIAIHRATDAARWISKKFFGFSEENTRAAIDEILRRSMTDPDLAKTLLMNDSASASKVVRRRLGTYITNNILASKSDDQE
jgi:hypothetical protein